MKRPALNRYDLPSSRILIRSLRYRDRRVESLAGDSEDAALKQELSGRVLGMVRDMFVVRLLEERRVLVDRYLCGGKKSRGLEGEVARDKLLEFNDWAGWEVFDACAWDDPGPGKALAELEHELHLARFWPPGMPVEVLGALWEERLPVPKRNGVFYTPRKIVDIALDMVFTGLSDKKRKMEAYILDPACGAGYFLLGAFRRLIEDELFEHRSRGDLFAPVVVGESGWQVLDRARRMELISEHIFGVDRDPVAIELARRALFIETLSDVKGLSGTPPRVQPLFDNLKQGDSILEESFPQQVELFDPSSPPPIAPFDWWDEEHGFGRILSEGGFTCIVGNPPWVSLKGRHKQAPYSPLVVNHLIQRYGSDTYRPNVVEFFIRRALELLGEGGLNSFVVPDRVADNEQYDSLRRHMADLGEMMSLHFREPFPGVAADTLIYLFTRREKPRRSSKIVVSESWGEKKTVPQSFWVKGEGRVTKDERPDEVESVLRKIESAGRRKLADFMETGVGFIARSGRITAEKRSDTQRPAIKGEHVKAYRRDGGAWFEFTIDNLAGGTRNIEKLTRKDRILLRKTGARLVAARDESGDLPEQSLYFAFPRNRRLVKNYDIRYFLGILNSKTMTFYFRHRKITNRSTTPQIKKVHLDTLPIRPIHFNDDNAKALHQELSQAVRQREAASGPEEARELEHRVEESVARLYGLSQQEMDVIYKTMEKG